MPSPDKFAHVVLRTTQLETMVDWWTTVLEANVRFGNDFIAFMSYDEEHHRIAIINMAGMPAAEPGRVGVDHIAYTYASVDDLFENYQRLKDLGIEPYWTIHHGATLSSYYRDPDGNQVELQVDTMSLAEADTFMRSPVFAANPIGIDVDFDQLVQLHAAGEPEESLLAYPGSRCDLKPTVHPPSCTHFVSTSTVETCEQPMSPLRDPFGTDC
ncbi:MAG: VOC family protein [Acidimicrobiaceae bacterium]|nr:VOC family protein [Acidimicrobiaceae bacterium]